MPGIDSIGPASASRSTTKRGCTRCSIPRRCSATSARITWPRRRRRGRDVINAALRLRRRPERSTRLRAGRPSCSASFTLRNAAFDAVADESFRAGPRSQRRRPCARQETARGSRSARCNRRAALAALHVRRECRAGCLRRPQRSEAARRATSSCASVSTASAPWPTAGTIVSTSKGTTWVARARNRSRPAIARTIASYSPSRSLRNRVPTFPRSVSYRRSGRSAASCARRRGLEVPTTRSGGELFEARVALAAEGVPCILALRDRSDLHVAGQRAREIFARVDRVVGAPFAQRRFQLGYEDVDSTQAVDRAPAILVAAGRDAEHRRCDAALGQARRDRAALNHRQRAATRRADDGTLRHRRKLANRPLR